MNKEQFLLDRIDNLIDLDSDDMDSFYSTAPEHQIQEFYDLDDEDLNDKLIEDVCDLFSKLHSMLDDTMLTINGVLYEKLTLVSEIEKNVYFFKGGGLFFGKLIDLPQYGCVIQQPNGNELATEYIKIDHLVPKDFL